MYLQASEYRDFKLIFNFILYRVSTQKNQIINSCPRSLLHIFHPTKPTGLNFHLSTPSFLLRSLHCIPYRHSSHATQRHASAAPPNNVNVQPVPMASRSSCKTARPAPAQVQRTMLFAACAEAGALGWRSVIRVPQNWGFGRMVLLEFGFWGGRGISGWM